MESVIFHIDVNSAFLSWSAVKMLEEGREDIRLVPSVISGAPSDRRSIVTAASIPAKQLGIKTAEPISMAIRSCPNLIIIKSDWEQYVKCSENFITICKKYSPILQKFSIDECFIDMTQYISRTQAIKVAEQLKDEIKNELGFTVNIGIGDNKLLAKMASDFEKPDKVHTLWLDEVPEKMWPLKVRQLLWVGEKTEEKLVAYGIKTIGDLAHLDINALTQLLSPKIALRLHENANGIDDSGVESKVREPKSYSVERTFEKDIYNANEVDRALFKITCIAAYRIRKDVFLTSCISLFIKYDDFSVRRKQCCLTQATDITAIILKNARILLDKVWNKQKAIRQIGICLSKLSREKQTELFLFEDPQIEYYKQWDKDFDSKQQNNSNPKYSFRK